MLANKMVGDSGKLVDPTIAALVFVESASAAFFLTGSRFFGNATENSDYDFFTEATDGIDDLLKGAGFVQVSTNNYRGTTAVVSIWELGKVQVQLVKNAPLKSEIQDQIKRSFPGFGSLDKEQRKRVWRCCYALLSSKVPELAESIMVRGSSWSNKISDQPYYPRVRGVSPYDSRGSYPPRNDDIPF